MTTYKLAGHKLMSPARMVRYAIHGYKTGDKEVMLDLLVSGWNLPKKTAEALLSGKISWIEDKDGTVEFSTNE